MAQTPTVSQESILTRYDAAAVRLACIVDGIDRIESGHSTGADRSADADAWRNDQKQAALADFRAVRAELESATAARELRRPAHVTLELAARDL